MRWAPSGSAAPLGTAAAAPRLGKPGSVGRQTAGIAERQQEFAEVAAAQLRPSSHGAGAHHISPAIGQQSSGARQLRQRAKRRDRW